MPAKQKDTSARLVQFFNQNPSLTSLIISEPSNLEIWESIFVFIFGEIPHDDFGRTVPSYWRQGSTDPRWDILLYKENMGAMRALNTLIQGWKNGNVPLPSHKEAA
ncbi:MAG: hypothetical protein KBC62_04545 [Candidatus Pacebacteria bacterium]|nr:hypothetical protein [Candidatus Paceibacterota bacterium]